MIPETPTTIAVRLVCPECSQALQVDMEIEAQLVVTGGFDGDEKVLKAKVKAQKVGHVCRQMTLDDGLLPGELIVDEAARRVNSGALGPDVTASTARVNP
jgi:hypothetical protein